MKELNNIKYIAKAAVHIAQYEDYIATAESYEAAKLKASEAFGFVNCMTLYTNTMVATENNDFTGELSDVLDGWMANIYEALAEKAGSTDQPQEVILNLLKHRDYYLEEVREE